MIKVAFALLRLLIARAHPTAVRSGVLLCVLSMCLDASGGPSVAPITIFTGPVRHVALSGADTGDCLDPALPCRTIQFAINAATSGDMVRVQGGTYAEFLLITKSVLIVGDGAKTTTIDAGRRARAVTIGSFQGSQPKVTLEGFTVRNGFVEGEIEARGGGILAEKNTELIVKGCDVTQNAVQTTYKGGSAGGAKGGGIYAEGTLEIYQTTVGGNRATGRHPVGGGIAALGPTVTIERSSIMGNRSEPYGEGWAIGGGIYTAATKFSMLRSTIGFNVSGSSATFGQGGGIFVDVASQTAVGSQTATIESSTIAVNQALGNENVPGGGGILNNSQIRVVLTGSVLMGNQSGSAVAPNCGGSFKSGDFNLVDYMAGCAMGSANGDLLPPVPTTIPVTLSAPGDYGGPTLTLLPVGDSPLIDANGYTTCTPTDQRGVPAADPGGSCDIGAVEMPSIQLPKYAAAELDVFRVTQGLDRDVSGGTYYKLIAGKDALVRLQIFARSRERFISRASCTIVRLTRLDSTAFGGALRSPAPGPVVTLPGQFDPFGVSIPRQPQGFFHTANTVDCWLNAGWLDLPGDYAISAEVEMVGQAAPTTFPLGVYTFYPTKNLRVLLFPYVVPPADPEYTPWDYTQRATIVDALREMNRRFPYRTGIGPIDTSSTVGSGGLRFEIGPVLRCLDPPTPSTQQQVQDAKSACDDERRVAVLAEMQRRNSLSDGLDPSGQHDRIDVPGVFNPVPDTGGGQARDSGMPTCVAGSAVESLNRGESASVVGQEIGHCLGLVPSISPNSNPPDTFHSRNWTIPVRMNAQLVDLNRRQDRPDAVSLMNGLIAGTENTFLEGWEWNWLNDATRQADAGAPSQPSAGTSTRANYEISGAISREGQVSLLYAVPLAAKRRMTPQPSSRGNFSVVFRDSRGRPIEQVPIALGMTSTHRSAQSFPFYAAVVRPPLATRVSLAFNGREVAVLRSNAISPSIDSVGIEEIDGWLRVSWNGARKSGTSYRVLFRRSHADEPVLVASGVTAQTLSVWKESLPPTRSGTFVVEASNGFAHVTRSSESLAIAKRPPVISIASPSGTLRYVDSRDVVLNGLAVDDEGRPVTRPLVWRSDLQGSLGEGSTLQVRLRAGRHRIALVGEAQDGGTGEVAVSVVVEADSDRDGIADTSEALHRCLTVGYPDGEIDHDGDGLSSRMEIAQGTDPCNADTDGDGFNDGQELMQGSDPRDPKSVPLPARIVVIDSSIDLGSCQAPRSAMRAVRAQPSVQWKAAADADWIDVRRDANDPARVVMSPRCAGLAAGRYLGRIMISAPGSQPAELWIRLSVP